MDDWARPSQYKNGDQIEKWCTNFKNGALVPKLAQAIFLSGAWGKIPDFMGKNRPTPGAAMAFLHAQNYPPKTGLLKDFIK